MHISLSMGKRGEPVFKAHWIWKLNTLPRIQTFLRMCCHNSIAVRECISKRGIMVLIECPICFSNLESIIHAFHDCVFAKHCWSKLGLSKKFPNLFSNDLGGWLKSFNQTNKTHNANIQEEIMHKEVSPIYPNQMGEISQ